MEKTRCFAKHGGSVDLHDGGSGYGTRDRAVTG